MEKICRFILIALHPAMMTTLGVVLFLNAGTYLSLLPPEGKRVLVYLTMSFTFILPLIFIALAGQINRFSPSLLPERPGPVFPLSISALFHLVVFYALGFFESAQMVRLLMLGALMALIPAAFLSFKYAISPHLLALGSLAGAILSISLIAGTDLSTWLVLAILAAGLSASALLFLGNHTLRQVLASFALGLVALTATFFLL